MRAEKAERWVKVMFAAMFFGEVDVFPIMCAMTMMAYLQHKGIT